MMILTNHVGLTLDQTGRNVLVGTVAIANEPECRDLVVSLELVPRADGTGQGVEVEAVTFRRSPGGEAVTAKAVHHVQLAQLIRQAMATSLPAYEGERRGSLANVVVIDTNTGDPHVGRRSGTPVELELRRPVAKPRITSDDLLAAATAWVDAGGASHKRSADQAAAIAVSRSEGTVRSWRSRYPDRWRSAVRQAKRR